MADEQKREKFRQTRELTRIAIAEGMTQEEIARLCRTQQSVVSSWLRGKSKAYTDQLKPLLSRFGTRLQRPTSRIYLLETLPAPTQRWEDTPYGQRLLEIQALGR